MAKGGLQTDRGCLTEAGLLAMVQAPVGRGPEALAQHVAACPRCQGRLLSFGQEPRGPRRKAPPPWRPPLLFVGGILIVLLAFGLLRILAAR